MTKLSNNVTCSLVQLDNNSLDIDKKEIIVFCCVRNEILLPHFLKYHRDLGVNRFIIIDNASTDETAEYLLTQDDVHLFYTEDSYAESKCGVDWINYLLSLYGVDHWTLTLDADELLIYPMCESVKLGTLIKYLDIKGAQGLVTFMLDMYSDKAIRDTDYISGESFIKTCNFFDGDTYNDRDQYSIPIRGGPRHRLFWQGKKRKNPSPVLKKIPLVKWRKDLKFEASTHIISNVCLASLTGVLLHFKLFSDFYSNTKQEVERKEHWDNAAQYASYYNVLYDNPQLTAMYNGSICYEDSMQLVRLSMLHMPSDFEKFVLDEIHRKISSNK